MLETNYENQTLMLQTCRARSRSVGRPVESRICVAKEGNPLAMRLRREEGSEEASIGCTYFI